MSATLLGKKPITFFELGKNVETVIASTEMQVPTKKFVPGDFADYFFPLHILLFYSYPSMLGASLVSLFSWPVTLVFIIGIDAHMCTRFCAVWHHQVASVA